MSPCSLKAGICSTASQALGALKEGGHSWLLFTPLGTHSKHGFCFFNIFSTLLIALDFSLYKEHTAPGRITNAYMHFSTLGSALLLSVLSTESSNGI